MTNLETARQMMLEVAAWIIAQADGFDALPPDEDEIRQAARDDRATLLRIVAVSLIDAANEKMK